MQFRKFRNHKSKKIYLNFFFLERKFSFKTPELAGISQFHAKGGFNVRASTASHHAPPSASACPLALHPAWHVRAFACRFRMPLGAFARARTTATTTQAAHTTQAANRSRILRIRIRIRIRIRMRIPPSSHAHLRAQPHRRSARDFTNHRCAASACLQTASHHRNQPNSQPQSLLNST